MENTQEVIDLIKANITPLVEASKEIGGVGWEILFKKAFWIDGIFTLLLGLFFSFLTYFIYKKARKITKREGFSSEDFLIVMFLGTAGVLSFILAISEIASSIPRLILPEYYVILEIIKTF
ncbi:MAG: hypothetical protein GY870_05585 [archaeon]|nr:hypothetical protein [archaeon]